MDTRRDMNTHQHHHHGGREHEHEHEQKAHVHADHQNDHDLTRLAPPRDELKKRIKGWGADLDRKNRPAVPMEHRPPRFIHEHEGKIEQQRENVEVLVSPERPGITPVFGTVQPPSGVSGMIRRAAFKTTENDIRHWLLLLLADRVNVVEGVVQDLSRGHVPNVLGEMGIKAEWKHNPFGLMKKVAIAGAVVGTAVYLANRRKQRY
jgi:hypothetical protein